MERRELKKDHYDRNFLLTIGTFSLLAVLGLAHAEQSNPKNFPDLDVRFRVESSLDPDGVHKLTAYRRDLSYIGVFDKDVVALERKIISQCGDVSRFEDRTNSKGYTPISFRLLRYDPQRFNCTYLKNNS